MWKRVLCFLIAFTVCGDAREYVVRYQTLSSGSLFHIESKDGTKIGKVVRENRNGTIFYSFFNPTEQLIARGNAERIHKETSVYLNDPNGKKIGWFSAEIPNLYPTEYRVYSRENRLLAKAFMNWLGNTFSLMDIELPKRYLVTYFRPMFKLFNDNWHFEVHEQGVLDLSILSVIGAFQTACDLNFELLDPKNMSSQPLPPSSPRLPSRYHPVSTRCPDTPLR